MTFKIGDATDMETITKAHQAYLLLNKDSPSMGYVTYHGKLYAVHDNYRVKECKNE